MASTYRSTFSPVIVGRQAEIDALERALHAARLGAGRCLLLVGEAGIGKSRLVSELRSRANSDRWTILEGHCFEQDISFPHAPWIDALRAFLAPRAASEIQELLGSLAPEFVKLLPELSLLIPGLEPDPPLDAESEKRRLFESVIRFLTQIAQSQPLLIVLEDLHWSDDQSLELMRSLVRRTSSLPILLVGTYRTEETGPRLARHLAQLEHDRLLEEIQLAPLSRAQVEQMARAILNQQPLSADWLDLIMSLTEGNPFFVQETLKSVVDEGGLEQVQIPRSIQESVQRRVERLPESTRHVLALAAVIGERFDFGLLQEITAQNEQSLLLILKELIGAQLIVEQSADQFAFRHALTRQAVYATLMLRERKGAHRKIAEAMERSAGTRTNAAAGLLAYHFYQGGVWEKALAYSQRAAEQAQALYAPREAITHFTQVIDAARQLGISVPFSSLRGRGQAREVVGEFDRARDDYESALELARSGGDRANEWQALIDLGSLWQSRDLKRAGEYFQMALEMARNLDDPSILGHTLNRVGNWQMNLGRVREALSYHREALELFREQGDRYGTARTLDVLGLVCYPLGEVIQGAAYLEQAVPIFRELGDRQALVNTLTNLGLRAVTDTEVLGKIDFMELASLGDEALQIAREFNWYQGEALALIQAALCLKQAGEYGEALARLEEAKPLVDESQNRESLARWHLNNGQIFTALLALSEARRHYEIALAQVRDLGSGILTIGATAGLASVALLQNDLAGARSLLSPLLPSEYPVGLEPFPLRRCWIVRAELELKEGKADRALEIVDRLLASTSNLEQYGPHSVPHFSRLRSLALSGLGRLGEAETELRGTLPVAQAQGLRPLLWRLHADLGNLYRAMGRREGAEREFSSARTLIQDLADKIPVGTIHGSPLRENFLKQAFAALPAAPTLTPRQVAKKEFGGLTAREREITALIAQGKSNREIAEALVISETTAERHVANILSKLGFNSRTQIAVWAVEKGLGK